VAKLVSIKKSLSFEGVRGDSVIYMYGALHRIFRDLAQDEPRTV